MAIIFLTYTYIINMIIRRKEKLIMKKLTIYLDDNIINKAKEIAKKII